MRSLNYLLELAGYLTFAFRHFSNPMVIFALLFNRSGKPFYRVRLKNGIQLFLRPSAWGEVSDLNILRENLGQEQYQLKKLVEPQDHIVDIGAQIGIFSLLAANYCKDGLILAFEPERSNFDMLKQNAALNPHLSIRIYNKAVTSQGEKIRLYISANNRGAHTTYGGEGPTQEVDGISLAEIIDQLPDRQLNLLKIDCEGGEYDILLNLANKDLKCIDDIIMEVHETPYIINYQPQMLFDKLTDSGFAVKVLDSTFYQGEGRFHIVHANHNFN